MLCLQTSHHPGPQTAAAAVSGLLWGTALSPRTALRQPHTHPQRQVPLLAPSTEGSPKARRGRVTGWWGTAWAQTQFCRTETRH